MARLVIGRITNTGTIASVGALIPGEGFFQDASVAPKGTPGLKTRIRWTGPIMTSHGPRDRSGYAYSAQRAAITDWVMDDPKEYGLTAKEAEEDIRRWPIRRGLIKGAYGAYGDDIGMSTGILGHGFNFQYAL